MRPYRYILSIVFLVAALAWTLWFVFAGFGNHQDPLYWLYKYEHLEGGWLAVGTLLAGGGIVRLFGASLLPLRIAGWICVATAIALPYCCLLDREQRRTNLHWLALAYVQMGYGAFQEFSPGALSVLLLSVIWVAAAKEKIWLAAIIAGLAIAVRFPNILVLLILIPLWGKQNKWTLAVTLLSAGIVYLLGYWLITPAATDAAMNSHAIRNIFFKLWEHGGTLVGYLLLSAGVIAIGQLKLDDWKGKTEVAAVLVGLLLVYFVAYTMKPMQWYNGDLSYLVAALCIVTALVTRRDYILWGIGILAVATLGTDTAWLKLFPAVLCLLAVAGSVLEQPLKRYLWIVMMVLSSIVVARYMTNSVAHTDLTKARTISAIAPYNHIFIRENEEAWLTQVKADVDSMQQTSEKGRVEVLALGQQMHLMRAVTGCETAKYNEFWSNIFDSVYTEKYREVVRTEAPIVICSYSPQFKTKPTYLDKQSALENMLREEGYREIDRSRFKYMMYVKEIQ